MVYNAIFPAWLGSVPRTYQQVASFVDATVLNKLRGLVEEENLKVKIGGVWEMEDTLKVSFEWSSRFS